MGAAQVTRRLVSSASHFQAPTILGQEIVRRFVVMARFHTAERMALEGETFHRDCVHRTSRASFGKDPKDRGRERIWNRKRHGGDLEEGDSVSTRKHLCIRVDIPKSCRADIASSGTVALRREFTCMERSAPAVQSAL